MNTSTSLQNKRFRAEMEVNPILQKVIAIYHITHVIAIIICVALIVMSLGILIVLWAIIPVILFIIFWVASKCNFQNLVVILVHYNPILSTMWFLVVFPFFVVACILNQKMAMFSYYNGSSFDVIVLVLAVITGILSLGSAVFAVMGIWKSARKVVLIARSGECDPVNVVGSVPSAYDAPVTLTDLNGIRIAQGSYGQPMLPQ